MNVTVIPPSLVGWHSAMGQRRAIFMDRDGVINRMVYNPEYGTVDSPANPNELKLFPGVGEAIAEINQLGFMVVVVSNQPGIAKRKFSPALLEAMTNKMISVVEAGGGRIDAIYYCLHHPQAALSEYRVACNCRKPKPGLLLRAAQELGIDLAESYMVGDGVTDVLAGQAAGVHTVFVSSRKCYVYDALAEHNVWPDCMVGDLSEAARVICRMAAGDTSDLSKYLPARAEFPQVGVPV